MDISQHSNSEPVEIKYYKTLLLEPPGSPPLLIDIRNNKFVKKDCWKEIQNSEESDTRFQMSNDRSSNSSFRLSDDDDEDKDINIFPNNAISDECIVEKGSHKGMDFVKCIKFDKTLRIL